MSERAWCILHNELAPSHGRITQDVHKKIDDKLKKLNVGTFKKISQLDNSWTSVQRAIMQYDFVTPEGNLVERVDKMVEGGFDCPKFSDPAFTDKVQDWVRRFVADDDVSSSFELQTAELAEVFESRGDEDRDEYEAYTNRASQQNLIHIGVLRFPHPERPRLKAYWLRIVARSDSRRINAEYQSQVYGIHRAYITEGGMDDIPSTRASHRY